MEELKILIVEDLPADAEIARQSLKKEKISFTSRVVDTAEDFKKALAEFKPDLIISGYSMPVFNGMSALKIARSQPHYIPFILLTGSVNEETAVACMKAGADDYVLKKNVRRLPFAVNYALQKVKAQKEAEEKLQAKEALLAAIYRNAPLIMLVLDSERRIQQVNGFATQFAGRSVEEMLGLRGGDALRCMHTLDDPQGCGFGQFCQNCVIRNTVLDTLETGETHLQVEAPFYFQKNENEIQKMTFLASTTAITVKDKQMVLVTLQDITDRKKAEEELRESEAKYRLLAENSGDLIFTFDFDLIYTYISPAVYALRGYRPEEIINRNLLETLTPASGKKVKQLFEKYIPAIKSGNGSAKPLTVELEVLKKDGSAIWVEVKLSVLTDSEGKPTGILGVSRDISKRKSAQDELRKLSSAVTQSPDSIVITDNDGNIEYVNPKFTQITGYKKEDVLGENPRILNSGEHSKSFYKELWDTILAGNDWYGEFHNKKKNGELYWESASISPLVNDDGEITHFVGVKENITERKKNEKLLKHHSELQQILLKIASEYIHVRADDLDRSINESLEEMGCFARAERAYIFDYDWKSQTMINTYEWYEDGVAPQIGNLQNVPMKEFPVWIESHKKGNYMYVSDVSSLPVQDSLKAILEPQGIKSLITLPMMDGENCIGFVGFDWVKKHHEYSDEEKILLSLYAQMLVNVKNRLKLENSLTTEKEKAQAADRLKTAFLNNISHEVRTPLNGILGFGEMLISPNLSENDKNLGLGVLQKSSKRLINTITDFMDISLIVSRNIEVNKKFFDLREVLQTVYEQHVVEANEKGLELRLETGNSKISKIETDPELLKKIMSHLLDNAIKFTKDGEIHFGYQLKNRQVEFYIQDNGTGIEQEKMDTIFDFFTQGDIGLTRGYEGSGLGLSISKGLVEQLGGKISLQSEKGKGTTVSFTLPWAPEETEEETPGNSKQPAAGTLVLIAEDDSVSRLYLETVLKSKGIHFISVENGQQAVEKCRENPEIGLVLMDLKMPVMDGYEATRQIKSFKPELPVIAITAQAMTGDREKAINAGCNDYISKPFDKNRFITIIKNYLQTF